MRTIVYTDDDSVLDLGVLPEKSKKIKVGSVVTINQVPHEVWYIEEVGTNHRNVRVKAMPNENNSN